MSGQLRRRRHNPSRWHSSTPRLQTQDAQRLADGVGLPSIGNRTWPYQGSIRTTNRPGQRRRIVFLRGSFRQGHAVQPRTPCPSPWPCLAVGNIRGPATCGGLRFQGRALMSTTAMVSKGIPSRNGLGFDCDIQRTWRLNKMVKQQRRWDLFSHRAFTTALPVQVPFCPSLLRPLPLVLSLARRRGIPQSYSLPSDPCNKTVLLAPMFPLNPTSALCHTRRGAPQEQK